MQEPHNSKPAQLNKLSTKLFNHQNSQPKLTQQVGMYQYWTHTILLDKCTYIGTTSCHDNPPYWTTYLMTEPVELYITMCKYVCMHVHIHACTDQGNALALSDYVHKSNYADY